MITVIGMWEPGFSDEQTFIEWRMWKQTILAYDVDRWCMVGSQAPGGSYDSFETIEAALDSAQGKRVFLIPEAGVPIDELEHPAEAVYIFGNVRESLQGFVRAGDYVASIFTQCPVDMFAASCLSAVLSARSAGR